MSSQGSPSSSPAAIRRRLNDGSALDIDDGDLTDPESSHNGSPASRNSQEDSQDFYDESERPYEIDTPLAYDARGNPPDFEITLAEADERLANLELQLDPTPGRRYRGERNAGLACWLCELPMNKRHPKWQDVVQRLVSFAPEGFDTGAEDTTGFQAGHVLVQAYIMALRAALQNHNGVRDRLNRLEELETRVTTLVVDLAGAFRMIQVCTFCTSQCCITCMVLFT